MHTIATEKDVDTSLKLMYSNNGQFRLVPIKVEMLYDQALDPTYK